MQRTMQETKDTFVSLLVVICIVAGLVGAVFYTFGPDGWFLSMLHGLMVNANSWSLVGLVAVVAVAIGGKRWLDNHPHSVINSLLFGAVAVGGLVVLLQGFRTVVS